MKCKHGFRGEIDAVLKSVFDKDSLEGELKDLQQDVERSVGISSQTREQVEALSKRIQKMQSSPFMVHFEWKCNCGEVNTFPVRHDIFPNTKEWAKSKIGKRFHVIITQLPRGGGASMDLHEITPKE